MNFVVCVALVAAVRSTAQGMVVIDPDGIDELARKPRLREDVAVLLAAEGLVKMPKLARSDEDDRVVEVEPTQRTSGEATHQTTNHPAGATDGLRDDDNSPPIKAEGDGKNADELTDSEIHRLKRSDLEALAAARGVSTEGLGTNAQIADAIIAAKPQ